MKKKQFTELEVLIMRISIRKSNADVSEKFTVNKIVEGKYLEIHFYKWGVSLKQEDNAKAAYSLI